MSSVADKVAFMDAARDTKNQTDWGAAVPGCSVPQETISVDRYLRRRGRVRARRQIETELPYTTITIPECQRKITDRVGASATAHCAARFRI